MVDRHAPPFTRSSICTRMPAVRGSTGKGSDRTLLQHAVITYGSPNAEAGSRFFNPVVEGVRTGEERIIVKDEGRRSLSDCDAIAIRKIEQLSAELQLTQQKLRQKERDEMKLRRKLSVTELNVEEMTSRHNHLVDNFFGLTDIYRGHIGRQNTELRFLCGKLKEYDSAFTKLRNEKAANALTNDPEHKDDSIRVENERLKDRVKALVDEKDELTKMVRQLQGEKEDNIKTFSNIRSKLTADIMDTQKQLHDANKKIKELLDDSATADTLVQQTRLFVQMVCQPDFHVVKDTSLEPVDRDRDVPSGFVLVPLTVMLQGYSLLPATNREDLVLSYQHRLM
uniref:Uncharacterized protein n=1 Tax=Trypanosoma congolense (strain IL3000) TaxID=1068625 RepID=G0UWM2_TRYCI|nr:conserved hypothetical protein [Trypanosoma congolense IL3000]